VNSVLGKYRPVVTLLTVFQNGNNPIPTATKDKQWVYVPVSVNQSIPDNQMTGINSDVTTNDLNCQQLVGINVNIAVNHPRPADLVISLSTVSADGSLIYKTYEIFNGPQTVKDQGLSTQDANNLQLPQMPVDASSSKSAGDRLLLSSDCVRWRLNVSDEVAGNTGTLVGWTLGRRTALFPYVHDPSYYQGLLFGNDGTKVVKPNAVDYFREVSRGNLIFTNAGIYGPVPYPNAIDTIEGQDPFDPNRVSWIIHTLENLGFPFGQFDTNGDNVITPDELEIVAIDNLNDAAGGNRSSATGCTTLQGSSLQVCVKVALVSEQVCLWTLCHEMSHSFGTVDLYGNSCLSNAMTLMSCEPFIPDDKSTVYLDPWHRWRIGGWVYPSVIDATFFFTPSDFGYYEVGDETWRDWYGYPSRPLILRNKPDPLSNEYFLFEYRGGRGYDNGVADFGLVVWIVKEDGNGNPYRGPDGTQPQGYAIYVVGPDNDFGSSRAWHEDDGNFQLHWADGTVLPYTFWVKEPRHSSNSVIVYWHGVLPNYQPPTVQIIKPADNSSGPYGFGNPTNFQATATDSLGSKDGLRFDWKTDKEGWIGSGSLIGYGFLTPGTRIVTVTVHDQYGASANASITYTLTNPGPTATIISPVPNATYYRNQPVYLLGNGSTPIEFSLPCNSLSWNMDLDSTWSLNDCSGSQPFNLTGAANFTLTVTDDFGQTASASVAVNFVDPGPNTPPIVTILAPPPGRFMVNQLVQIKGLVTDPAGGPVTYRWTVIDSITSIETQISTSSEFDWLPQSVVAGDENIEIRLYGTNSNGISTLARQQYYVDKPPQ